MQQSEQSPRTPPPEGPALRGRDRLWARLLRLVSVDESDRTEEASVNWDDWRDESTKRFFDRLPTSLEFEGKRVLDVGCGWGNTCMELVRRGTTEVVGVDIEPVTEAKAKLAAQPDLAQRCEFLQIDVRELAGREFDVIISQDSMEHYGDPESFVPAILRQLAPGGLFVVGFGPLWKAPLGGHSVVTRMPWAHLIFPEPVMMAERRRYRPNEDAERYEEVRGGLNRMTLARFERIMAATGMERLYFATNRGDHPATRLFRVLARIAPLREYVTTNVYSVWRRPGPP